MIRGWQYMTTSNVTIFSLDRGRITGIATQPGENQLQKPGFG